MQTVNIAQKLGLFSEQWSPKVVGEVNDCAIKLAKIQGEFMWHHHDYEDELFLVVKGVLRMRYRENGAERELLVREGEFVVVPRGIDHLPSADEEVSIMLVEPITTLNTGNVTNARTVTALERI